MLQFIGMQEWQVYLSGALFYVLRKSGTCTEKMLYNKKCIFHFIIGYDITDKTIKNYIDHLKDAFLVDTAIRYDIKGKKYINTPMKIYFADPGLRNARLGFISLFGKKWRITRVVRGRYVSWSKDTY